MYKLVQYINFLEALIHISICFIVSILIGCIPFEIYFAKLFKKKNIFSFMILSSSFIIKMGLLSNSVILFFIKSKDSPVKLYDVVFFTLFVIGVLIGTACEINIIRLMKTERIKNDNT